MTWLRPAGSVRAEEADVLITPEDAGWAFSGLRVITLHADVPVHLELTDEEAAVVPLSAEDVEVTVDGTVFRLAGRRGVFESVSDWLYVPVGSHLVVSGSSGEVAVCTARTSTRHSVAYVPATEVPVEVRGAGRATRQVTNIATPESFAGAERLLVCEVITPGGNWSSWPPHRHDGVGDCAVANEEIYYFRVGREGHAHGTAPGVGLFRVYTVEGDVDETVTVRDGDVYLVPRGFHGPSVAPPEYPMYFLNVLAGPNDRRTMAFCDDPDHHWIRDSWQELPPDPRLPLSAPVAAPLSSPRSIDAKDCV